MQRNADLSKRSLLIDVTSEAGLGIPAQSAAWVFHPPAAAITGRTSLLFCFHGGSYTKAYYHMEPPGHRHYSFANHLAELGHIVVAVDHLGMGESTAPPDAAVLTPEVVCRANHAVVNKITAALSGGTVTPSLPPLEIARTIGIGHSMGGYLLVHQQHAHGSFDAIANLGGPARIPREIAENLIAANRELAGAPRSDASSGTRRGYLSFPRELGRSMFHLPDVPADLIEFDDRLAVPTPAPLLAGLANQDGSAALSIDVPLFLCFGEVDGSPHPHGEVAYYKSATDITLLVLKGSAHCHNFATTRHRLWDRLAHWVAGL